MSINGHHTVSWGVDVNNCPPGSMARGLFEPSERFRDENGDPIVGMEARYLQFVRDLERKSGDGDGGLIEVQVFRCRGRKRIAVVLDPCPKHNWDRHGVTLSSGGLVDDPQDASFYEYHLEDARDSPYATFYFHYRCIKYLEQLNVIPSSHETGSRPASTNQENTLVLGYQRSIACMDSWTDGIVFGDGTEPVGVALSGPPGAGEYSLKTSPQLSPARLAGMTIKDFRQSQDDATSKTTQRPLPEPPQALSGQVSKESIRSNCPSLTPSLKRYVESEEFEKEDIQLSTAHPVFIPSESMQALELDDVNVHDQGDSSFSDYATSPSSTETSRSPELPPPESYLPTTSSVLERELNQFDPPVVQFSLKTKAKSPISQTEGALVGDLHPHQASTLTVTEAEWLRRSPSPQRSRSNIIRRLWSPRLEKRTGRSSMVELPTRAGEATNRRRSGDEVAARNARREDDDGHAAEVPAGNWI